MDNVEKLLENRANYYRSFSTRPIGVISIQLVILPVVGVVLSIIPSLSGSSSASITNIISNTDNSVLIFGIISSGAAIIVSLGVLYVSLMKENSTVEMKDKYIRSRIEDVSVDDLGPAESEYIAEMNKFHPSEERYSSDVERRIENRLITNSLNTTFLRLCLFVSALFSIVSIVIVASSLLAAVFPEILAEVGQAVTLSATAAPYVFFIAIFLIMLENLF